MVNVGDYTEVKTCTYKGEIYSVRDNGAVYRHCRAGKAKRKKDEIWSFGIDGDKGYLYFCGTPIHRIAATAFHPMPDYNQLVVDHIDTNRKNNRPENLRWLTREENILKNPITIKKIESMTSLPIEEVLKDPSILRKFYLKNTSWMGRESEQEASRRYKELLQWEYSPKSDKKREAIERPFYVDSLTPKASQHNKWITSGFFHCVQLCKGDSLGDYLSVLKEGMLIYEAENISSYKIYFKEGEISEDGQFLYLICYETENNIKPYIFMTVEIHNKTFAHSYQGFFDKKGPEREMALAMNREWTGGDVFDDYC
ncbi:MAG: HNH endonuclease [Sphaerochaetaceae bacterium]|nr:HNH endonuclease [Sphaerochaetaceae bacterium]